MTGDVNAIDFFRDKSLASLIRASRKSVTSADLERTTPIDFHPRFIARGDSKKK